jgi:hypothetical protein
MQHHITNHFANAPPQICNLSVVADSTFREHVQLHARLPRQSLSMQLTAPVAPAVWVIHIKHTPPPTEMCAVHAVNASWDAGTRTQSPWDANLRDITCSAGWSCPAPRLTGSPFPDLKNALQNGILCSCG